jgi:hypothetical protein
VTSLGASKNELDPQTEADIVGHIPIVAGAYRSQQLPPADIRPSTGMKSSTWRRQKDQFATDASDAPGLL